VVFVAATVLGVPNPLVLGLIAGVLEFVPNLGPLLALVPAALLALVSQSNTLPFLEGPTFALVVIIVWTLIQNVESLIIVPRVMGGSLNLHPVVVIVGVLAGASFAGALGVILAAPAIASVRLLLHYIYGKVTDQQVFPAVPAEVMLPPRPTFFGGVRRRFEDLFGG
jgi:predicted PurR-regulated permease PerM